MAVIECNAGQCPDWVQTSTEAIEVRVSDEEIAYLDMLSSQGVLAEELVSDPVYQKALLQATDVLIAAAYAGTLPSAKFQVRGSLTNDDGGSLDEWWKEIQQEAEEYIEGALEALVCQTVCELGLKVYRAAENRVTQTGESLIEALQWLKENNPVQRVSLSDCCKGSDYGSYEFWSETCEDVGRTYNTWSFSWACSEENRPIDVQAACESHYPCKGPGEPGIWRCCDTCEVYACRQPAPPISAFQQLRR